MVLLGGVGTHAVRALKTFPLLYAVFLLHGFLAGYLAGMASADSLQRLKKHCITLEIRLEKCIVLYKSHLKKCVFIYNCRTKKCKIPERGNAADV